MPPCAYSDDDSRSVSFAITSTDPADASSIAARRPATPAPITRKSGPMYSWDSTVEPPSLVQGHPAIGSHEDRSRFMISTSVQTSGKSESSGVGDRHGQPRVRRDRLAHFAEVLRKSSRRGDSAGGGRGDGRL